MTGKKTSGGQPGPRGAYKPRKTGPTALLPNYKVPLAHAEAARQMGGDNFRALLALALDQSGYLQS